MGLNRYITLEKKRRRPLGFLKTVETDKLDVQFNRNSKEILVEFQIAQRRGLIIELIKEIYWLDIDSLQDEIKGLIVFANLLYKNLMKEKDLGLKKIPNNDAFCTLLSLYGDPEQIIEKEELDAEYNLMSGKDINSLTSTNPGDSDLNQKNSKNLNYMKQKMSKERMYELAMKKGVKADPKVLVKLKEMRENYIYKKGLEELKEEKIEEKELKKVQAVRELIVVKTLGFGVALLNQKNFDADLLRPLDSVKHTEQETQLIDMNNFEDHDREAVNSLFKKYGKLFKTYFVLFSSGVKNKEEDKEDVVQTITRSDIWAFLKDKKLESQISMEELGNLVRQINLVHFNVRGDSNNLTFKGYKIFILEASTRFFPETTPMPPAFSLKKLLAYLENVDSYDEKISKIFENPEYAGVDDYDLIKYLNKEVNKNPKFPIPDSFMLSKQKVIDYEFKLRDDFKIKSSYKLCYELLNDLVSSSLGFDFLEPLPKISEVYFVKPRIFFKDTLSKKLSDQSKILFTIDGSQLVSSSMSLKNKIKEPKFISDAEKKMMFAKPLVELSTNMKFHVANYDMKDKAIAKDCAYVLEELLQKAAEGMRPGEGNYHLKIPVSVTIENDLMRKKELDKIRSEKREIKDREDFKARSIELKDILKKDEESKRIKQEEEERKEKKRLKELMAKQKKKDKEAKKKAAKMKKEIENKEKKEKKIIEDREKRAAKRLEDIKIKRRDKFLDFQEARIKAFKKEWREKFLQFKDESQRRDFEAITWAKNQKIENTDHLLAFRKNKEELVKLNEEKERNFNEFRTSPQSKEHLKRYKEGINETFLHYCRIGDHEIGHEECLSLMSKKEIAKFFEQFRLYPVLITPYQLNKWYSEVDLKEGINKYGINKQQFEDLLLMICYDNKEFLSGYYNEKMVKHKDDHELLSDIKKEPSPKTSSKKSIDKHEYPQKQEDGIMPSMRKKPSTFTNQNDPSETKKSKKDVTKDKDSGKGPVTEPSNVSMEASGFEKEEDIERELDALEGLMLYTGIIDNKKEMKARLKDIYENYKHEPSYKRQTSKIG